ncbi:A24 family peptidase [Vogesella indigofera]|uniref:A24 family peptidase n=1 Tax=Vogesella indigofera TaxID=45465 RepID=UPI00234EFA71|nr:prepilin peptidase [Vogesella indigofera]MDC7700355.1 prepilin peptidase [Vogesella indigofera]
MIFIWLAWIAAIGIGLLFGARLGLLAGFLLAAVFTDMETRKIPNKLVLAGIAVGLLAQAFQLDGEGIVSAIKGLVFGFGLFLPLYLLRVMGAGDVKLMALVGCFTGSPAIFGVVLCTLLAGGVLSLTFSLKLKMVRQMLRNSIFMMLPGAAKIAGDKLLANPSVVNSVGTLPYAMAIAIGTAGYLIWQGI